MVVVAMLTNTNAANAINFFIIESFLFRFNKLFVISLLQEQCLSEIVHRLFDYFISDSSNKDTHQRTDQVEKAVGEVRQRGYAQDGGHTYKKGDGEERYKRRGDFIIGRAHCSVLVYERCEDKINQEKVSVYRDI